MEYEISRGAHTTRELGMCAMEWVAWLAGERHTDAPGCVDARLASQIISLNDNLAHEDRQRLKPYLARMVGLTELDARQCVLMREVYVHPVPVLCGDPECECARANGRTLDEALAYLEQLLPKEYIEIPNPEAVKALELIPA